MCVTVKTSGYTYALYLYKLYVQVNPEPVKGEAASRDTDD